MSGDYVCDLDETTQQKALEELSEDPKNRQGAIDTFRQWIRQQKHIKCPTDDVFLLAFLRTRKFSQLASRKLLENYLERRQKLSKWFLDHDPCDAAMEQVMDDRFNTVLPGRDKEGRQVWLVRIGDMSIKRKNDCWRAHCMLLNYMHLCQEMTQVHGLVTIIDASNMTLAHTTKVTPDEIASFVSTWQKRFPARIKVMHFYNVGPFMEFMMMIVKSAMPEKIQKRLIIHGQSLELLYEHVPLEMLPEEYLPDDYNGPKAGTLDEIIGNMKKMLAEPKMRARLQTLSSKEFGIDLKVKDTDVIQESFRKLNVD